MPINKLHSEEINVVNFILNQRGFFAQFFPVCIAGINKIFKVELVALSLAKAACSFWPKDITHNCISFCQMLCVEIFYFWHLPGAE